MLQQQSSTDIRCHLIVAHRRDLVSPTDVGFRPKAEAVCAFTHCFAFQILRRSVQTPVRNLSELMFVEQEPVTAAAMNLAAVTIVSQAATSALSASSVHGPSSSAKLCNAVNCLLIAMPALTTRRYSHPSYASSSIMRTAETFCRDKNLLRWLQRAMTSIL